MGQLPSCMAMKALSCSRAMPGGQSAMLSRPVKRYSSLRVVGMRAVARADRQPDCSVASLRSETACIPCGRGVL